MKGGRKGHYAHGGSTSKARDIGIVAPREGENSKIIAEAKKGTTGIIAEGGNALPRLDRPGRARGGSMKKGC